MRTERMYLKLEKGGRREGRGEVMRGRGPTCIQYGVWDRDPFLYAHVYQCYFLTRSFICPCQAIGTAVDSSWRYSIRNPG